MKAAANLSHLWPELPYLDRFDAAAKAGFTGVEVLFPYDIPAKDTQRALLRGGLQMVLINAPPPNYTGGQRGSLCAGAAGADDPCHVGERERAGRAGYHGREPQGRVGFGP